MGKKITIHELKIVNGKFHFLYLSDNILFNYIVSEIFFFFLDPINAASNQKEKFNEVSDM